MTTPADRDDDRMRRAADQERRALQALESIMRGGDLSKETLDLSNEFTDRHTARIAARLSAWWRHLRPRTRRRDEER